MPYGFKYRNGCVVCGHDVRALRIKRSLVLLDFVFVGKIVANMLREVMHNEVSSVKASTKGYAAAWLKEHPYSNRTRGTSAQHQRKALDIASVAVYSILRDWIKGQITAIETGILSFEGAFLGQILLGNGKSVLEHVAESKMLPALEGPKP